MNSVIVKLDALINQRHAIYEPKLITRRVLFRPLAQLFNIEFSCVAFCDHAFAPIDRCNAKFIMLALCAIAQIHFTMDRIAGACDFAVCNVTARRRKRVQYHKSRNVGLPSVEIAKLN